MQIGPDNESTKKFPAGRIPKKPMMDHQMRLNNNPKIKEIANSRISEMLKDGIIDEKEAKELGLAGDRAYDLSKKEDLQDFNNDLTAISENTQKPKGMKNGKKPPLEPTQD